MVDVKERKIAQEKALKERKSEEKSIKAGDFIIPALSVIALVLLSVFVYVPMIKESQEVKDQIETEEQNIETLNSLLVNLKTINKESMNEDYSYITKIIPSRMEVADFAQYIDQSALENNLTLDRISASSQKAALSTDAISVEGLYGVTGPLRYDGYYDDIVTFVDGLNATSPYLISLSSIKMNKGGESAENDLYTDSVWTIEMSVTGYYIIEIEGGTTINYYVPLVRYDNDEDIMNNIRARAAKLEEE